MTDLSYIAEDLHAIARPIEELVPDPTNVRRHPQKNLDAMRASLTGFQQRKNVVVQVKEDGTKVVRAGNATLQAALVLGWTHLAWAEFQEDDVTATAYAIADNRTAELAEWDRTSLASLLESLQQTDYTPAMLGWDSQELDELLKGVELSLGHEDEGSGFADGDQFADAKAILVVIEVTQARFDAEGFKQQLQSWCDSMGLSYKATAK